MCLRGTLNGGFSWIVFGLFITFHVVCHVTWADVTDGHELKATPIAKSTEITSPFTTPTIWPPNPQQHKATTVNESNLTTAIVIQTATTTVASAPKDHQSNATATISNTTNNVTRSTIKTRKQWTKRSKRPKRSTTPMDTITAIALTTPSALKDHQSNATKTISNTTNNVTSSTFTTTKQATKRSYRPKKSTAPMNLITAIAPITLSATKANNSSTTKDKRRTSRNVNSVTGSTTTPSMNATTTTSPKTSATASTIKTNSDIKTVDSVTNTTEMNATTPETDVVLINYNTSSTETTANATNETAIPTNESSVDYKHHISSIEGPNIEEMVNETTTTTPASIVMLCPEILDLRIEHKDRKDDGESDVIWTVSDEWMQEVMEITIIVDHHIKLVLQKNTTEHSYLVMIPSDKITHVCLIIRWNNCVSREKCVSTTKGLIPYPQEHNETTVNESNLITAIVIQTATTTVASAPKDHQSNATATISNTTNNVTSSTFITTKQTTNISNRPKRSTTPMYMITAISSTTPSATKDKRRTSRNVNSVTGFTANITKASVNISPTRPTTPSANKGIRRTSRTVNSITGSTTYITKASANISSRSRTTTTTTSPKTSTTASTIKTNAVIKTVDSVTNATEMISTTPETDVVLINYNTSSTETTANATNETAIPTSASFADDKYSVSSTEGTNDDEMVNETATTMPDTTVTQCPDIVDLNVDHRDRKEGEESDIIWTVSDAWMEEEIEISINLDYDVNLVIQENMTKHSYPVTLPFDKEIEICLTIRWNNCRHVKCVLTDKGPFPTAEPCPEILDLRIDHRDRKEDEESDIIWTVSDSWMEEEIEISITVEHHIELVLQENTTEHSYPVTLPFDKKTKVCLTIRWYNCISSQKCVFTTKESLLVSTHAPKTHGMSDGSAVAVAFLVILIVAVIALFIYKSKRRFMNYFQRRMRIRSHTDISMNSIVIPSSSLNRPIVVADFEAHFEAMSSDSKLRFAVEFEELNALSPMAPCAAAILPENQPKNRWINILPFDHSRVKLLPIADDITSDYINANYIPGYKSQREYIATQGPLPTTIDDFWRMVWEQGSPMIVMLTQCVERGKVKCEQYWPTDPQQKAYYGDLAIIIKSESMLPDYTLRIFDLQLGSRIMEVKQCHFTMWPDFGCPESTVMLLNFIRSVAAHTPHMGPAGPTVVHCSAGVGRTGTFIAVERLMKHVQDFDAVDVFHLVKEMRKYRNFMVQTEDQYVYIHECIRDFLLGLNGSASSELSATESQQFLAKLD